VYWCPVWHVLEQAGRFKLRGWFALIRRRPPTFPKQVKLPLEGRWARFLLALVVASMASVTSVCDTASARQTDRAQVPSIWVSAHPLWGRSTPGEWTPYVVTVRNADNRDFNGEVVLVPSLTAPPAKAPVNLFAALTQGIPTPRGVSSFLPNQGGLRVGGRLMTIPAATADPLSPDAFPTHRAPLTIAAGSEKAFTVLMVEAPSGYGVRVVDPKGNAVATVDAPLPPPPPVGQKRSPTVALMTSVPEASRRLASASASSLEPLITVTPFSGTAREFPHVALELAGLDAIVIDDFDTAGLTAAQRGAIKDYVALGGTIVLGGGNRAVRTLSPLPAELTPLRPSGTAAVSLGPLAQPGVTATAATGELGPQARTLVAGEEPGSPPLVVEGSYGAGRVLEMTFDPFAEPIGSDPALAHAAWDKVLAPIVDPFAFNSAPAFAARLTSRAVVPHEQIWSPALQAPTWPGPEPLVLVVLGAYSMLAAVLGVVMARSRRHGGRMWAAFAIGAVATSAALVAGGTARAPLVDSVVQVATLGPQDSVLTTTYHGFVSPTRSKTSVDLPDGTVASTVFALPVYPVRPDTGPPDLAVRGAGHGVVTAVSKRHVTFAGDSQNVHNLVVQSLGHSGGLESHLRVESAGPPAEGSEVVAPGTRVKGTITNHSAKLIHDVRGQLPSGSQAWLAGAIGPGATAQVDAPLIAATPSGDVAAMVKSNKAFAAALNQTLGIGVATTLVPDPTDEMIAALGASDMPKGNPEELVMFAAASHAFTGAGQIAVVGIGDLGAKDVSFHARSKVRKVAVVVQAVKLGS